MCWCMLARSWTSFGVYSCSSPSRLITCPVKLCLTWSRLLAKWKVRVDLGMYSFYGPAGKVLCNFVKEEWNVSLTGHSEPFLYISISPEHCKSSWNSGFLDALTKVFSCSIFRASWSFQIRTLRWGIQYLLMFCCSFN